MVLLIRYSREVSGAHGKAVHCSHPFSCRRRLLWLKETSVQLVQEPRAQLRWEKSKEGSAELCKDEEQHIMSGHLRAPLAAIAEIMLQSLSKNAPDLPTHFSLSLCL
ncbi:unnamed protein product [Sphagnum troendelagicum]|uniref:Uncharacterized protein n=1 Tax=Sphagnum troendelagicum TaxID=128251 RepID=A0ABP0UZ20_9BRYO